MSELKKHNLKGEEVGSVKIDETFLSSQANSQMVKDYLVALRNNLRQWSANTKGRSEINATKKKVGPQKGSGNARHGARSAPQFKGGGVVFGPKPKFDQHVRINKKERRAAIRQIIADKIKENAVYILADDEMDAPKTKTVASFKQKLGLNGPCLFVGEGAYDVIEGEGFKLSFSSPSHKHDALRLSVRNLPRTYFSLVKNLSGLDVAYPKHIIMTEDAVNELVEWLS